MRTPKGVVRATQRPTRRSIVVYLALMAGLVVIKLVLDLGSVKTVVPSQSAAFSWPTIGFMMLAGGCAVWLGPWTDLPELWDPGAARRKALLASAGLGAFFGGVNLAVLGLTGFASVIADAANVAAINVPFPESLLFYTGGAIVVESLYRLILITLPLWLIGNVLLRKPGRSAVFWTVALTASLAEPLGQMSLVAGHPAVMVVLGSAMYAINVGEAYLFRRHGFLAPLAFRIAFYLVWHGVGSVIGY